MTWSSLPNIITFIRILMAAPLAWAILDGRHETALIIALLAGFSDAFDGFLAKHFGWQSELGGWMDPVADKLMLLACFLSLSVVGVIPIWLTILIVGRDLVIVVGAVAYHIFIQALHAKPTWISKLTTALQIFLVLLVLVQNAGHLQLGILLDVLIWAISAVTIASGADYLWRWTLKARRELANKRSKQ